MSSFFIATTEQSLTTKEPAYEIEPDEFRVMWSNSYKLQIANQTAVNYNIQIQVLEKGHRIDVVLVWHYICLTSEPEFQSKSNPIQNTQKSNPVPFL